MSRLLRISYAIYPSNLQYFNDILLMN